MATSFLNSNYLLFLLLAATLAEVRALFVKLSMMVVRLIENSVHCVFHYIIT